MSGLFKVCRYLSLTMFRVVRSYEQESMSLEKDLESGECCLCLPFIDEVVRGGLRFRITESELDLFAGDDQARTRFANRCRQRLCDDLLIEPYLPRNGKPCVDGDSEGLPFLKEYTSVRILMVFIQQWFNVSYDFDRKQYYLGVVCDYSTQAQGTEEYRMTPEEYESLVRHPEELIKLAGKCQRREANERLMNQQGSPWYVPPPEPKAAAGSGSTAEVPESAAEPESEPAPAPVSQPGFFRRLFGFGRRG